MKKKYSNKYLIKTGIGLQDVDHLENSDYFLQESEKYISGEISLDELKDRIDKYYKNKPDDNSRTKEADDVSTRIADLLSDDSFSFTIGQLLSIHRYLFEGHLDHPGQLRTYNFTKSEWVLNGDTVIYGDYRELEETLQYDLKTEKEFKYKGLSINKIIDHLAVFIANLWQIHPFEEGNTRTIAVFVIKYLRTLGFNVTNDTFAKNAWYFRNALVRANYNDFRSGSFEDKSYLVLFLRNLLLDEQNELKSRNLHVIYGSRLAEDTRENKIITLMRRDPSITIEEIASNIDYSVRTVKSAIKSLEELKLVRRVGGKKLGHWVVKD